MLKMEHKFMFRRSSNGIVVEGSGSGHYKRRSGELKRMDTADFPMKIAMGPLIEEEKEDEHPFTMDND